MDNFLHTVAGFIASNSLLQQQQPVIAALSGGADSVALLMVLSRLGYKVIAAHCNFHLRGEESMRDERFVRALCNQHHIALHVKDFDVQACMRQRGISAEMACRDLRYEWFEALRCDTASQAIAVAHHRDDNIETFMLNALRGTGIAGLTGMHPRNGHIVRPLLCVTRSDIEQFLKQNSQDYVTDSTNLQNDVKRNKLRNVVLPCLYQQFPGAEDTLAHTIDNTRDCNELYRELVAQSRTQLCVAQQGGFDISIDGLRGYRNALTLLFEILKPQGFKHEQCCDIVQLFTGHAGVGKTFLSSTHKLVVGRERLEVMSLVDTDAKYYPIDLSHGTINEPLKIKIEQFPSIGKAGITAVDGKKSIALDAQVLKCKKIELRHWQEGDRFSPFGLRGSKLVSDLFTDMKLSEREKKTTWLLVADGTILWVVGYRSSSHYSVGKESESYVTLTLCP